MNYALAYLTARSFINRLRFMLSRMREPRYLVPFLIFAGYLVLSGSGFLFPRDDRAPDRTADFKAVLPLIVECSILFFTCVSWFSAVTAGAPTFAEGEATILLQSPISRRRLIAFAMVRAQPQLAIVSLIFATFGSRGTTLYYGLPAIFLLMNFIIASRMAVVLLTARLSNWRWGVWLARVPAIALAGVAICNVALAYQPVDDLPGSGEAFNAWMGAMLHDGPLSGVMMPFRVMAGLSAPMGPADFLIRVGFVAALIVVCWCLIYLLDSPWEEAAIARAQKVSRLIENFRQGRAVAMVPTTEHTKPARFALAPAGPLWRAFAWKSMTSLMRQGSSRTLVVVLTLVMPALAFGASMASGGTTRGAWVAPLIVIGMIEFMLPMMGPALFPHDIRGELQRIDLLKSFPVPGRDIMRGGVWACTAYVGFYQIALLVIGVALVNGPPLRPFPLEARFAIALALLPVMPMITAMSFALEGAGAVLMPSWLMPRPQAGVEAAGRNMLMAFIRMVGASLMLIPVAAVAAPLGYLLWVTGGVMTMPIVGFVAGAIMWLEVEGLMAWSGGRLATLDPAQEAVS